MTNRMVSWVHFGDLHMAGAVEDHRVLMVDMGHTHYNGLANDGRGRTQQMRPDRNALRLCHWDLTLVEDGLPPLTVRAQTVSGLAAEDTILAVVDRNGGYLAADRKAVDYQNAMGAWPEEHILGTQLGPNEYGHGWPTRRKG